MLKAPHHYRGICLPGKRRQQALILIIVSLLGASATASAQQEQTGDDPELDLVVSQGAVDGPVVSYSAAFFDRYQPNTALDMVNQVPGFQLDDGDDERGLGGAAGNLLINDRHPSAKQDTPSQILQRIPAARVERIELIRGQVREIDLRGRSVVANLVMVEDVQAEARWDLNVRKNFKYSALAPSGSISVSSAWRGIDYNTGISVRRSAYGDPGSEDVFDGAGVLTELRNDDHYGEGYNANANLNASALLGDTLVQLNSAFGWEERDELLQTTEFPQPSGSPSNEEIISAGRDNFRYELGVDAERNLRPNLLGRGILLFSRQDKNPFTSQRNFDTARNQTLFRQADTETDSTESIARVELDWVGMPNHEIQTNLEGARNVLDSGLVQIVDTGSGPEIVAVPGANSRVEEVRWDILISDTWTLGDFELDYGLGAETSTISQSGDAELKRSFFFAKPHAVLSYSATEQRQTRLRLAREVSQLDFSDFVSATVFEDDDLALGNPDLRPETTWIAELSEERRFGSLGVMKLTAFHHWISDVEDLLPLSPTFEAPGNIGDGRRWGIELEGTLPLEAIGLVGGRLDIKARWQDSSVTDPVTGADRVLSANASGHQGEVQFRGETQYSLFADFRQDFEAARISWGWDLAHRTERPLFKVNELDIFNEGMEINAFVETTRWFGLKMSITGQNLTDHSQDRDRTVYAGERSLSPVAFREVRDLRNGTRVFLSVSGTF